MGLRKEGNTDTEFENRCVAFFGMNDDLTLTTYLKTALPKDVRISVSQTILGEFSVGQILKPKQESEVVS
jgi:hypothetical protein